MQHIIPNPSGTLLHPCSRVQCLLDPVFPLQACTSFCGFSLGDIVAQIGTSDKIKLTSFFKDMANEFDYGRLARMAAFGFCIHGVVSHFFYNALDTLMPGTATTTVLTKVGGVFRRLCG